MLCYCVDIRDHHCPARELKQDCAWGTSVSLWICKGYGCGWLPPLTSTATSDQGFQAQLPRLRFCQPAPCPQKTKTGKKSQTHVPWQSNVADLANGRSVLEIPGGGSTIPAREMLWRCPQVCVLVWEGCVRSEEKRMVACLAQALTDRFDGDPQWNLHLICSPCTHTSVTEIRFYVTILSFTLCDAL